jgi:hypothetical protein
VPRDWRWLRVLLLHCTLLILSGDGGNLAEGVPGCLLWVAHGHHVQIRSRPDPHNASSSDGSGRPALDCSRTCVFTNESRSEDVQ